jgi:hypothetical protein
MKAALIGVKPMHVEGEREALALVQRSTIDQGAPSLGHVRLRSRCNRVLDPIIICPNYLGPRGDVDVLRFEGIVSYRRGKCWIASLNRSWHILSYWNIYDACENQREN